MRYHVLDSLCINSLLFRSVFRKAAPRLRGPIRVAMMPPLSFGHSRNRQRPGRGRVEEEQLKLNEYPIWRAHSGISATAIAPYALANSASANRPLSHFKLLCVAVRVLGGAQGLISMRNVHKFQWGGRIVYTDGRLSF